MIIVMNVLLSLAVSCALAVIVLYLWFKHKYTYWKIRDVKGPTPSFPFGNVESVFRRKQIMSSYFDVIYNEYQGDPYIGIHVLYNPSLVVRDPALIGRILNQDYNYFDTRGFPTDENNVLSTHLFSASGPQWRMLRTKLSPTFTSGKMKMMYKTMEAVANVMSDFVKEPAAKGMEMNFKDLLTRYTTDVIGSCAFGIDCNSFENGDSEFRKYGNRSTEATVLESIAIAVHLFAPELRGLVNFPIMCKVDVRDFFVDVFNKTTSYRERNNIQRNDFLQLLIQLKNNKLTDDEGNIIKFADGKGLPENLLVSQLFIFFVAGYETSSTAASFAMYELAINPHIQEKARQEIVDVLERHRGECTYEALMEMDYLTYVIDETLRKYPPLGMLFRRCTIPYNVPGTKLHIEKGTMVFIPISAIQMDPKYFKDPEKFQPERFMPANKNEKMNSVYMPFGLGPRYCIGQRFGMMQAKLALAKLLVKYEVSPSSKTTVPLEYDPAGFTINPIGGIWLKINEYKKKV